MDVVNVEFIFLKEGSEITTNAKYNKYTGEVFDIEISDETGLNGEFIRLEDSARLEIENDGNGNYFVIEP